MLPSDFGARYTGAGRENRRRAHTGKYVRAGWSKGSDRFHTLRSENAGLPPPPNRVLSPALANLPHFAMACPRYQLLPLRLFAVRNTSACGISQAEIFSMPNIGAFAVRSFYSSN
jgi:hypothetical protein